MQNPTKMYVILPWIATVAVFALLCSLPDYGLCCSYKPFLTYDFSLFSLEMGFLAIPLSLNFSAYFICKRYLAGQYDKVGTACLWPLWATFFSILWWIVLWQFQSMRCS